MTHNPPKNSLVFKIATAAQWRNALALGVFSGSPDDRRDGFIHMSARHQLEGTLAKHFSGQGDLVLVAFNTDDLTQNLNWEASRGGDLFPHLYSPLETGLALWTKALVLDWNGVPKVPEDQM